MNRILTLIICLFTLISASYSSKQNQLNEKMNNETVNNDVSSIFHTLETTDTRKNTLFYFDNSYIEVEAKTKDGKLPDMIGLYWGEERNAALIETYLQEKGNFKERPDDVSYHNGENIAEYYLDIENRKICFILDQCFLITLNLDENKKIGSLIYRSDDKKNVFYESLYDVNGNQAANITYEYIPDLPFPLITEYKDSNNYKESVGDVLYRSQKFWFYKKMAKFDEGGKLITYDGDIYEPDNINRQIMSFYDKSGKLNKLEGSLSKSDIAKYFAYVTEYNDEKLTEIELSYQENDMLDTVNYYRSPRVYGTTGSTGKILYDKDGRMICEYSYITHGSTYNYYLYNGDERKPWACIFIDSMPYSGSEQDGVEYVYGNYYSIYLFQPDMEVYSKGVFRNDNK